MNNDNDNNDYLSLISNKYLYNPPEQVSHWQTIKYIFIYEFIEYIRIYIDLVSVQFIDIGCSNITKCVIDTCNYITSYGRLIKVISL